MTAGASSMNGEALAWRPASPFPSDPEFTPVAAAPRDAVMSLETPFLNEYSAGAFASPRTPQATAFAELYESLRDEEFDTAVARVADEASAIAESLSYEGETSGGSRERQRQAAQGYLDRIATSAEAALRRMDEETSARDLAALSESALNEYLDTIGQHESGAPSPVAEEFVKKWIKKAKQAVSGAVKLAKRGIKAVTSMLPHTWILRRLIGLVRPFLHRVLRFALDKVPVALQPIARQLAAKVLGSDVVKAATTSQEAAAVDPRAVATEMDTMVAGYVVQGESFTPGVNLESMSEDQASSSSRDALRELDQARAQFIDRFGRLRQGEDPTPAVEQFVPAVLGVLRLARNIIGRPRIVSFLSGHLARLVQPHIGEANAKKLAGALVDAGLRLVQLEGGQSAVAATAETVASTLEDTVARLAESLPTDEWESPALLEAYSREAFDHAVAANFPDDTVRGELHEAHEVKGVWRRAAGRRFKRYTRTPSVVLTPRMAQSIPSFKGVPLSTILRDRFGITGPVRVNVHLYEAIPGTTVGAITRGDAGNGGPAGIPPVAPATSAGSTTGTADQATPSQGAPASEFDVHPLTETTAGLLLQEPGLGRRVDEAYLETPHALAVGQRLFRLEFEAGEAVARGTQVRRFRSRVNAAQGSVDVLIYFSEATAQEVATALRRKAPAGVVLNLIRRAFEPQARAEAEGPSDAVQLVSDVAGEDSESFTRRWVRRLGGSLRRAVRGSAVRALASHIERNYAQVASDFDAAANADADGVTIRLTMRGLPWLATIGSRSLESVDSEALTPAAPASLDIKIVPGYAK